MTTPCTCGSQSCSLRAARGFLPFCSTELRERTAAAAPARSGFDTRSQAEAARQPGQAVVGVRAGVGHGPMRFVLRGKARAA